MSIEKYLQSKGKTKPNFREVAGKLMSENQEKDPRPWKWEVEITEDDWKQLDEELEKKWAIGINHYLSFATRMRLLDPTRKINLDEGRKKDIRSFMVNLDNDSDDLLKIFETAMDLHLIDSSLSYTLSKERWDVAKELIDGSRQSNNEETRNNGIHLFLMGHFFEPGRIPFVPIDIQHLKENDKNEFDVKAFLRFLTGETVTISKELWDRNIAELAKHKYDSGFVSLAASARILSAYKVEMTKEGIEITDRGPEILDVSLPSRPVRKKIT